MKVKQILEIMKTVHNSKLPYDMELLDKQFYTSESQNKTYAIDDMDIIHLIRSFIKIYNYDEGLQQSVSQTNQILKLEKKVSELLEENEQYKKHCNNSVSIDVYENLKERNQDLHKRLEEKSWTTVTSPKYDFCEIPNNNYGRSFIDAIKMYLNTKRYTVRVRGHHIKEEYKGTGATAYGQSIDQSTHLRVYIEEK